MNGLQVFSYNDHSVRTVKQDGQPWWVLADVCDVLELKKEHPCGSKRWQVLRVGMDFKLRCEGCGHELMLPRSKAEKNIKKILRTGEENT